VRTDDMAKAAGRLAGRWLPVARSAARSAVTKQASAFHNQWMPAAKQSEAFVKHVVPAAVKPLHSLWHQILGFVFLVFAGLAAWKVWRTTTPIDPLMLALVVIFIIVMAAYGIASIRKSNRISRS
jgi:hypothetical protein